jgi:flavin-dependent dehydrogenase
LTDVASPVDVAIVGGGLSGLTLALQLARAAPALTIAVFERSRLPPQPAAHKVGEATVEIGARYLAHTLGLEALLERTQLHKFGLRMFFGSGCHDDLARADELGSSRFLEARSYQLDRGILERDLLALLADIGVQVEVGCQVKQAEISANDSGHELIVVQQEHPRRVRCRWLVDASSRTRILKRALKLDRPVDHRMCAAWFRLDCVVDVDDWSDCPRWKARCGGLPRRLSTNHLMGPGYWAWIIPLAGDRTSIGLVTDPELHPLSSYDSFDRLLDWAGRHQPGLAAQVSGARDRLLDFRKLKNLSQDSVQLWSGDGWALAGEAGVFTDPFYSPGTDFIGIGNTFISDLIVRERTDSERGVAASVYQKLYRSFFGSTMSLYEQQYPGFGDTRLMVVKSTWDYAYYWSILSWLFFRGVLTDLPFLRTIQPELTRIRALNFSMQTEFRKRASMRLRDAGRSRFFDQSEIPVLANLNTALLEASCNPRREFSENCARLDALAPRLLPLLADDSKPGAGPCSLLGDLHSRLG